jgi:hypothetical protein
VGDAPGLASVDVLRGRPRGSSAASSGQGSAPVTFPAAVIGLTARAGSGAYATTRDENGLSYLTRSREVSMASRIESSSPPEPQPRHTGQARPRRYEPTPVYALAEHLKQEGVKLRTVHGPWRPIRRALRRPGRNAGKAIPIVTNGVTELAVDTAERAADVSGFLNWCGVDHIEPVANLRPPDQDLAYG